MLDRLWNAHPLMSLYAYRKGWIKQAKGVGCVYVLIDPRDRTIRYVGMTTRHFSLRLQEHRQDPQPSVREWVGQLEAKRLRPELAIVCYAPRSLLEPIELIVMNFGYHLLGWKLLNVKGLIDGK